MITSTLTTTTTTKPKPPLSLANDVTVKNLLNDGYVTVYEYLYSHSTTSKELDNITATCTNNTILCVGGRQSNSQILRLVSCVNCLTITGKTVLNKPILENFDSFGFSPNATIYQGHADFNNHASDLRLSWHLDLNVGGWRLGKITNLNSNNNYYKMIFKK